MPRCSRFDRDATVLAAAHWALLNLEVESQILSYGT